MANLGYVGLGLMGGAVAKRLIEKGHTVTGHNRTRSKVQWLEAAGMRFAQTPREVAEAADIVFSMVTDTKALHTIVEGPDGILAGLKPGKIYIDMSTVDAAASRALSVRVAATGAQMLDAPVSGNHITLQQGALAVMVGGSADAFERARPVLLDIGPKVTHVGANGLALAMKIASNLGLAVQMLAFCEAVLLAEKSGIARSVAVEVLTNSVVASPMIKYRGPFVMTLPDEAWFNVNMMQKDMNLAIAMGQQLNVPLPTTATTNEFLTAARAMGYAQKDFAVIFDVLAEMAGVTR
jgi:3-hydroxyisobutyrate dehydrogenase-like beta-hydroxyacid dehydrogenase